MTDLLTPTGYGNYMTWAVCRDLTGFVLRSAVNGEGKGHLFDFKRNSRDVKFVIIMRISNEMNVVCSTYEERRGAYKVLVENPEEKRPLGRPRRRWEDTVKKDLLETRSGVWTGLISLRIGTGGRSL